MFLPMITRNPQAISSASGVDIAARYTAANWVEMPSGSQALADAMLSFSRRLSEARPVGTHHLFIGQVIGIRADVDDRLYSDRNDVPCRRR